jgi:membrane protein YdbS with pleckstrin-like domain
MFEQLRNWLLHVLRVPPEPEPPFGNPASTRIFRASPKYYYFRLLGWGAGQVFALVGLIVGVIIMLTIENRAAEIRNRPAFQSVPQVQPGHSSVEIEPKPQKKSKGNHGVHEMINAAATVLAKVPPGWFFVIWFLELMGLLFYLSQMVLTYAALRLDYELRWYVVTDRSLRIRTGIWRVQELTMSFANLQQVVLSQGPVQRLLGIADVLVQSAGGGGSEHGHKKHEGSLHAGYFHGVDNAAEVRDLILARLRHFRETGLGDPDEARQTVPVSTPSASATYADAVMASRELLQETRQLRSTLLVRDQTGKAS